MQSDSVIYAIIIALIFVFIYWSYDKPINEKFSVNSSIPKFDAYQLMEQPSDPRYVFVPEIRAYLLPFDELDFGLEYHRWMYYYFPMYYEQYYDIAWPFDYEWSYDLYYGGNYGGDYGGDFYGYRGDYYNKKHPKKYVRKVKPSKYIPDETNMPKINTLIYPTKKTGFSGGQYSQRYSGAGSRGSGLRHGYDAPNFHGIVANTKEKFTSLENSVLGCGENLINPNILTRGGNNKEFTPGCSTKIKENFGETETINGVFVSRDDKLTMKPVYGTLTWTNDDQTANGYPPYPTYPASEVYPNGFENQNQTTYRIPSQQGYPGAKSGVESRGYPGSPVNQTVPESRGYPGSPVNQTVPESRGYPGSPVNQDNSNVPMANKQFYGEPKYSPEEEKYLTYPTLNKGYLSDQTNWKYEENLPDYIRQQKIAECERDNDKEFCKQRYGYFPKRYVGGSDDIRSCVSDIYEQDFENIQRNIATPYDQVGFEFIRDSCRDLYSGDKPKCTKQCNDIVENIKATSNDNDLVNKAQKMKSFCVYNCNENDIVEGNSNETCNNVFANNKNQGDLYEFVNQGKCMESCVNKFPNLEQRCVKNCNDVNGYMDNVNSFYKSYCNNSFSDVA